MSLKELRSVMSEPSINNEHPQSTSWRSDSVGQMKEASIRGSEGTSSNISLKKAHDLAFWAFAISQGQQSGITIIFEYIHYLHPNWRIEPDLKTQLEQRLAESAQRFATNASHTRKLGYIEDKKARMAYTVDNVIGKMEQAFNSNEVNNSIPDLFVLTIDQDYHWLYELSGRPEREKIESGLYDEVPTMKDPFVSFFCRFGIEGEDTRVSEYNQMFQEIAKFGHGYSSGEINLGDLERKSETAFRTKFNVVLLEYSKTHPTRKALWPSEWLSKK